MEATVEAGPLAGRAAEAGEGVAGAVGAAAVRMVLLVQVELQAQPALQVRQVQLG